MEPPHHGSIQGEPLKAHSHVYGMSMMAFHPSTMPQKGVAGLAVRCSQSPVGIFSTVQLTRKHVSCMGEWRCLVILMLSSLHR